MEYSTGNVSYISAGCWHFTNPIPCKASFIPLGIEHFILIVTDVSSLQAQGRQLQWKVISEPRNLTATSHTHIIQVTKYFKLLKVVQTHKFLIAYKCLTFVLCSFVLTVPLSVAVNTTWETTKTFWEYYFPYFLSFAYTVRLKQCNGPLVYV